MWQLVKFRKSAIRWFMALSWTIFMIVILLKPGNSVSNREFTLSSFLVSFFSLSVSRKELSEAIAHVIMFGILTALWQWVLIMNFRRSNALLLAISIAAMVAIGTEIGQYFVNRGSSIFDLGANFLGITLTLFWIKRQKS